MQQQEVFQVPRAGVRCFVCRDIVEANKHELKKLGSINSRQRILHHNVSVEAALKSSGTARGRLCRQL